MRSRREVVKVIGSVIIILIVANFFILSLLPKIIAYISGNAGCPISSADLVTKYSMGIAVRVAGLLLFFYILKVTQIIKWYTCKLDGNSLKLSWLFVIYIAANIEIGSTGNMKLIPVFLMILESMITGIYEETVFRGLVLPIFLKKWGTNRSKVISCVLISNLLFGLAHLLNLFTGADLAAVVSQVFYATMIGTAFSALLLRTKGNLVWCGVLHGFYDMASGFGDFTNKVSSGAQAHQAVTSIVPYLMNVAFFIPIFLYGLFLLRKITAVTAEGKICME